MNYNPVLEHLKLTFLTTTYHTYIVPHEEADSAGKQLPVVRQPLYQGILICSARLFSFRLGKLHISV